MIKDDLTIKERTLLNWSPAQKAQFKQAFDQKPYAFIAC